LQSNRFLIVKSISGSQSDLEGKRMNLKILRNSEELGKKAAGYAAQIIKKRIDEKGSARIALSTGASQFETIKELVKLDVDWNRVEMFHLDEYMNLPESHPASFRRYLKERFVNIVNLKNAHFVCGEGDVQKNISELSKEIRKEPIDLGLIGIGENAHIAFNDPPADFDSKEAYITVKLDEHCRKQQVGEGWFESISDVPEQAITMTVHQILQCEVIVSCVPNQRKADAIRLTLESDETNKIPATKLKSHPDWTLFLDEESASLVDKKLLRQ
jgi:glucosamine-6-phosphate deaminase